MDSEPKNLVEDVGKLLDILGEGSGLVLFLFRGGWFSVSSRDAICACRVGLSSFHVELLSAEGERGGNVTIVGHEIITRQSCTSTMMSLPSASDVKMSPFFCAKTWPRQCS